MSVRIGGRKGHGERKKGRTGGRKGWMNGSGRMEQLKEERDEDWEEMRGV